MDHSVKAKCRVCGKDVPADQLKLNYTFGKVVCPMCFKNKTEKTEEQKKAETQEQEEAAKRPRDWDAEDAYLEKYWKYKNKETSAQFSKIKGTDFVKCTCENCKYSFKYDPFRKQPHSCPYCNKEVPKFNTYSAIQ